VALGPLVLIQFVRMAWALIKSNPGAGPSEPAPPKRPARIEPTVSKERL
jgi:hypothetical protein